MKITAKKSNTEILSIVLCCDQFKNAINNGGAKRLREILNQVEFFYCPFCGEKIVWDWCDE